MGEIANKLITQNKVVQWFLMIVAAIFTGICSWGFIESIQAGLGAKEAIMSLPSQLIGMWGTVIGLLAAGKEDAINKVESATGIDIDKDGDIGIKNATPVSAIIAPTETVTVAPVPTTNTAVPADEGPI